MHDSHDLYYREPFGAVGCRAAVRLRIKVAAAETPERVFLSCWRAGQEERVSMTLLAGGQGNTYETTIAASPVPGLVWYYFGIVAQGRTSYYGNNAQRLGGRGQVWEGEPAAYQITVFRNEAVTPGWFKESIVYQIFVDRFFNGNPEGEIENPPPGSLLHTSWDDTPFYIRDMRTGKIFAYDFFGGNLRGVLAKLPYLKQLGVGAIYLNPVFESPSNHKYDTGDYKKIDPLFGDYPLFSQLCSRARELGMAIILDGVFSHTGSDSRYFNKEGRYPELGAYQSTASPYFPWYRFHNHPDQYECWWGIDTLPNVNELEPSYLDFIADNEDSVLKYWLRAGIKGWRLDVADELPGRFIKHLHTVLKAQDPAAVLIGEVWEDASRKVSYGTERAYLLGDELDSVTNYPFRSMLLDFILGVDDAAQTQHRLTSLAENYPREHFYAALNMLGSHDVPRILSLLGEAPPQESLSIIDQARYRLPAEQRKLAVKRLKLLVLWQMTFPGTPCIYYGDEAGMEGYADPFNRGTYPWGREDRELLVWYQKLTNLRQGYAVLRTGDWLPLAVKGDVYGYLRRIQHGRDAFGQTRPNNLAVVVINRSTDKTNTVSLSLSGFSRDNLVDVLADNQVIGLSGDKLELALPPLEGKLLLWRTEEKPSLTRGSGVLLQPTSLSGPFGIGDFGPGAYAFVDFLARGKQKYWQILPLNPAGYGDSPYQSVSAFAGDPLLISPALLVEEGLLAPADIADPPPFDPDTVMFAVVKPYKEGLLRTAFKSFQQRGKQTEYQAFVRENGLWLEDYALFMAVKTHFDGLPWSAWPVEAATRDAAALTGLRRLLAGEVAYYCFLQYIFSRQWRALKRYANGKGVKIIGDVPIFVAFDSCDVWANQQLFQLDAGRHPRFVAGVPPDYFSAGGQLWGNPLYDWSAMAADDYRWWRARCKAALQLADIVRIDHFRGFEAFWAVPAGRENAIQGTWMAGPGQDLFASMQKYLGPLPVIAEDLGLITRSVEQLRDKFNYPGMKVLHFLFEAAAADNGPPAELPRNSVVYTGTHDNNTTVGWLEECLAEKPEVMAYLRRHLGLKNGYAGACWRIIEFAFAAEANTVIIPLQDILCLGAKARMNRPGTVGGNWVWRCRRRSFSPRLADRLAGLTRKYDRGS